MDMLVEELIPKSEIITHLTAIDIISKKECSFTKKIIANNELELIGGKDEYIACDRERYHNI